MSDTEGIGPDDVDPNDVTASFDPDTFPPAPLSAFVSGNDVMKGAEDQTYLGRLTEAEAKQLVTRSTTLTRWTDMMLDMVANDGMRFGYESKAEIIRHAIEMLLAYYKDCNVLGEHDGFITETMRRQHAMRLDAERARVRKEFADAIDTFDTEMMIARKIGDYEHLASRLQSYREILRTCETETQRRIIREVLAGSVATRQAVSAFWKWTHETYRTPIDKWDENWVELSEIWARFYLDMESA